MAINLGNVAGVVRSVSAPLEEDGVTVKRYVLWAKPLGPVDEDGHAIGGLYNTFYWSYSVGDWVNLDTQLTATTTVNFGAMTVYKRQGNTEVTREAGDVVQGFFNNDKFIMAVYNGGEIDDINSYSLLTENDLEPVSDGGGGDGGIL